MHWLTPQSDSGPGPRIRVGPGGVLLGRDPACDVVLSDPTASRHHALVHPTPGGLAVRALGRQLPEVNGEPLRACRLVDGDLLCVPGLRLEVSVEGTAAPRWQVATPNGPRLALAEQLVFGAGGDVAPGGWPPGALTLRVTPDGVAATGGVPWQRNGVPCPPAAAVLLAAGDAFGLADATVPAEFALERSADEVAATGIGGALPEGVELQFLARGGRLRVWVGGEERVTWVAERRFALLMCLLDPPAPLRPGDDVPDEWVLARVWPRQAHKSRVDLNVLVGRLRGDLEPAGFAPTWVARSEGGGGTRFRLAPGATVAVHP
ncbi:MAG: FHA domain-containing protein [Myxococcota bacterium]